MEIVTPDDSASGSERSTVASRRAFLTAAGAAAAAGLAATACSADSPGTEQSSANEATPGSAKLTTVDFYGTHQAGPLLAPASAGIVAAFDVVVSDRAELVATMQSLSAEIERLMANTPAPQAGEIRPPVDSGAIDAETGTAGVAITLGVGASLFDGRFGLGDRKPNELIPMPRFFNDRQVREEFSHGDLQLTISAPNPQVAAFALHQIVRVTDRQLRVRWVQEGYNQLLAERPGQLAETRNLMGFRDGTSNPDRNDADEMSKLVWVSSNDDEPDWATGGTYQAVRVIRMLIEFWGTTALVRQEQIIGRHRDTGAPLGQTSEGDVPAFASDPNDEVTPRRSHVRLANPRTSDSGRILRRGFSYLNGADSSGTLDQGLIFLCYQRSLRTGFFEVQSRLDGEPLEEYIKPVGGGLFFVVPGPGKDGWLGESLFA